MGGLYSRRKTWIDDEDVTHSDLNAEFDEVLTNFVPLMIDDYSANTAQMQVTTDPGESGTESLATTLAGELARIRFLIKEITGESLWYTSPSSSLAGLENVVGTGLTDNRLVSGRVLSTSAQPAFLVPNGAARTIKLDGTPTNFLYYVDGIQYTISTDVTLTPLTAAPSSNNTCLIDDAIAADQYWTKYAGEDGTEIPVDAMGTEISNLVGKFAAFKLDNGAETEYFTAYVKSTTSLTKARRGYFFDSADAPKPRVFYSNNDTITLLKLTWVFAQSDGTLTVSYTNPVWSDDEPSSPSTGDYWFDLSANTWKVYGVASFSSANAILVGICVQDTANTIGARSFEFFDDYSDTNTIELFAESNTQVKSRRPGHISVWGSVIKNEQNLHTWDMTLDLESGVTEAASTYYYFYITETGDKVISNKKPHDRREDLQGYYHPSQSWRCVGWAFNNSSSHLEQVESYYHARESQIIRSVIATDALLTRDRVILFSGASFTEYLPPAASCRGNIYTFLHNGTSLSQVYTLDAFSAETIGGSATVKMHTNGQMLKIISDGTNWLILDSKTNTTRVTYAPTFTGWTSPTSTYGAWARSGSFCRIEFSFSNNTGAAGSEGRVSLPGGLTAVASGHTELQPVGAYGRNLNSGVSTAHGGFMHQGVTALAYVVFSAPDTYGSGNVDFRSAANASAVTPGNTDEVSGYAVIEMTDWLP
jgi:hypothetical protein